MQDNNMKIGVEAETSGIKETTKDLEKLGKAIEDVDKQESKLNSTSETNSSVTKEQSSASAIATKKWLEQASAVELLEKKLGYLKKRRDNLTQKGKNESALNTQMQMNRTSKAIDKMTSPSFKSFDATQTSAKINNALAKKAVAESRIADKLEKDEFGKKLDNVSAKISESTTNRAGQIKANYDKWYESFQNAKKVMADDTTKKWYDEATAVDLLKQKIDLLIQKRNEYIAKGNSEGANSVQQQIINTQAKVDKLTQSNEQLAESTEKVSKSMNRGGFHADGFAKSLLKIAKLRLLRGIIRSITQGFKEGTDNLYEYSRAMNSMDSNSFKSTMDGYASALLMVKNSVGAAVAPLAQALLPVIQSIANAFIWAANAVNMFLSALGGKSTYTRATNYMQEYGSAIGEAGGAAADLKNTILDFDDLNPLNDNNSGGGGGGGGATPDYSKMFEESEITQTAMLIKDLFEATLPIVMAIGSALAGWKIANNVTSFFDKLGIGKGGKMAAGITIGIAGLAIEAMGAFDMGKNGINLKNAIQTALGAALGIAGSLIVFGTGPLGWAIGIGATLTVGIVGYITGEIQAEREWREELYKTNEQYAVAVQSINEMQSATSWARDTFASLQSNFSSFNKEVADANIAKVLIPEIYDLAEKTSLSSEEVVILQRRIDTLNRLGLTDLKLEYNSLTGEMNLSRLEAENLTQSILEQAETRAKTKLLEEAYDSFYRAQVNSKRAEDDLKTATENYEEAQGKVNAILDECTERYGTAQVAGTVYKDELRELLAATDLYDEQIKEAKASLESNNKVMGEAQRQAEYLESDLKSLSNGSYSVNINTDTAKNKMWELQNVWNNLNFQATASIVGAGSNVVSRILGYAEGGYVSQGQLFIANEQPGALPEMVGTIGNKTAVANGGDIVMAIQGGVRIANEGQNELLRQQNDILRQILAKDNGSFSVSDLTNALSRNQRVLGRAI